MSEALELAGIEFSDSESLSKVLSAPHWRIWHDRIGPELCTDARAAVRLAVAGAAGVSQEQGFEKEAVRRVLEFLLRLALAGLEASPLPDAGAGAVLAVDSLQSYRSARAELFASALQSLAD